jgi:hypothetical protein
MADTLEIAARVSGDGMPIGNELTLPIRKESERMTPGDYGKFDQFLVNSVNGEQPGCRVIVDYTMDHGTMRVPPDVFQRMKDYADADALEKLRLHG